MGKKTIDYLDKAQNIHLKFSKSAIDGVLTGMKTHLALALITYLRDSTTLTRSQILRKLKIKAASFDDLMNGKLNGFTYEQLVELALKLGFAVRGHANKGKSKSFFKSVSFEFTAPDQ